MKQRLRKYFFSLRKKKYFNLQEKNFHSLLSEIDRLKKMETELEDSRYKVVESENLNKNLKEEVDAKQTELQVTKEQLEEILKNKKMFVKKIDELSQETDAMLGEFDKW